MQKYNFFSIPRKKLLLLSPFTFHLNRPTFPLGISWLHFFNNFLPPTYHLLPWSEIVWRW